MKKLLFLACTVGATLNTINAQTTAAAKALGVGANVSVRGVVINGSELGIIRYIQDITGGIAAYGSPVTSLNKGDSVLVSGPLTEYYNLFEIAPPVVNFISANATIPILVAFSINAVAKAVMAVVGGGRKFSRPVILGLMVQVSATWLGWWLF